jgi:hypothetical protein
MSDFHILEKPKSRYEMKLDQHQNVLKDVDFTIYASVSRKIHCEAASAHLSWIGWAK